MKKPEKLSGELRSEVEKAAGVICGFITSDMQIPRKRTSAVCRDLKSRLEGKGINKEVICAIVKKSVLSTLVKVNKPSQRKLGDPKMVSLSSMSGCNTPDDWKKHFVKVLIGPKSH